MTNAVRISEYYDLFDISISDTPDTPGATFGATLDSAITNTYITNPFIGFSNGPYTQNTVKVEAKHFSDQALNTVSIDENGNISCYPPNSSVPYWNKIIFRNFDYQFHPHNITNDTLPDKYLAMIKTYYLNSYVTDTDSSKDIYDYGNVPLFLRFPEYRSRSHVVFSACDKTRNPDIEFVFGYNHGASEPVILTLSMSASNQMTKRRTSTTPQVEYNANLNKECINKLLTKCYWCIEWQYIPEEQGDRI